MYFLGRFNTDYAFIYESPFDHMVNKLRKKYLIGWLLMSALTSINYLIIKSFNKSINNITNQNLCIFFSN